MSKFAHLHLHSEYSLLDGSIKLSQLPKHIKELGMNSVALTDHGAMYGVVQFYKSCKKEGIKPIIGCEVYVCNNMNDKLVNKGDNNAFHLVLLAENNEGYQNLIKIVSEGFVNGFYYRPRVDKNILRKYHKGIIASSACLGGEIPQYLLKHQYELAVKSALEYEEIFGSENFFLELQDHGIIEQAEVNQGLLRIHYETSIPMIATNDAHYLEKQDADTHDVLLCIQTGTTVQEENRMKFPSDEFYVKSTEEMAELFYEFPNAIKNTQIIADRCNVELDFETLHLPSFPVPDNYSSNTEYLKELIYSGLKERYGDITEKISKRYLYEFETIVNMGYTNYFLIVWDFIRYAREQGIQVGPGRGSAAGSIVSYALKITDIDPLKHGLLFERFLNPERVSMPDIDIDFCYERREEVINYVIEKYGADHVAQIVTFGTMAARGAVRDVGRALDIPYNIVDSIAKQVPNELGMTLTKALDVNPQINIEIEKDSTIKKMIEVSLKVEGLPRHTSTHAAGVLIAKEPVTNYVPLARNGEIITTQFNMTELEELGMLKMDFLGLRTLTVIRDSMKMIKDNYGIELDLDSISFEDPEVLRMFADAHTLGIFQFESAGMRSFLKELKPDAFEDLVAANSLYRPGPMNQIPTFIKNKHDKMKIEYIHPKLESILNVTYGCIVYQEQVMQIVRKIGGYSLGRADLVRRAMSKKKMDVMEQERHYFINGELSDSGEVVVSGAVRNGVDEESANKIFDLMIDFANYAFNKSHSVAYAVVAYRTAYLKRYYPVEFMAALISSIMSDSRQVALYLQECTRLGIKVLPPDINNSFAKFTVEDSNIRFGLSAIKNVGINMINTIISARKNESFINFSDFAEKTYDIDSKSLNKRAVESLIKAGVFSNLNHTRAQLLTHFENLLTGLSDRQKKALEGQFNMFADSNEHKTFSIPYVKELSKSELLNFEKEVSGIYLSGHPLEDYKKMIASVSPYNSSEIFSICKEGGNLSIRNQNSISFSGMISTIRTMVTKNNQIMAFLTIEDLVGQLECIMFPKVYKQYATLIKEGSIVSINGKLTFSEIEDPKIIIENIKELTLNNTMDFTSKSQIYLQINRKDYSSLIPSITNLLEGQNGSIKIKIYIQPDKALLLSERQLWLKPDTVSEYIPKLEKILGEENVIIK
ncbi:MAG: DNA polymerase III subunit alpha [Tissierellia bacterium]|nr:DNA polymerase III subunit alpha [Tissierellia bacterium]